MDSNTDDGLTPQQRWRKANPEKAREATRRWAAKNQEHLAESQRARVASRSGAELEKVRARERARYQTANRGVERQSRRLRERESDPVAYDRKQADIMMRSKFHRTLEDYERVLSEQGGHCSTCSKTEEANGKRLCWDHDHGCCPGRWCCGECVRGLLCTSCNYLVGKLESKAYQEVVRTLMNYLDGWQR